LFKCRFSLPNFQEILKFRFEIFRFITNFDKLWANFECFSRYQLKHQLWTRFFFDCCHLV